MGADVAAAYCSANSRKSAFEAARRDPWSTRIIPTSAGSDEGIIEVEVDVVEVEIEVVEVGGVFDGGTIETSRRDHQEETGGNISISSPGWFACARVVGRVVDESEREGRVGEGEEGRSGAGVCE